MNGEYEKLMRCYEQFRKRIDFRPETALILGSGLGEHGEEIETEAELPFAEIEGFPVSTVSGHRGKFLFGRIGAVPVVVMQGRVHYYEGYSMEEVALPVRLMKMMGAEILFLTNAAGGISFEFSAGDFMLIRDHISCFVPSPLRGPNLDELGTRFPDMSEVYDRQLRGIIKNTAEKLGIALKEGVYVQLGGPCFETPAEILLCRALGADAVGMSTACEAAAARHMGMRICGISCIANMASGMTGNPLTHREVQETAEKVAPQFRELVFSAIRSMGGL